MDHKIAPVTIENASSRDFIAVGISHKYSDVFKDHNTWSMLNRGEKTQSPFAVHYNTGFFTTGRDWWYLIVTDSDGNLYHTDPSNFRGLFDSIDELVDKFASSISAALTSLTIAGSLAGGAAGAGYVALGGTTLGTTLAAPPAVVVAAVTAFLAIMTNPESTSGFKQFILTDDDEDSGVLIRITDDEVQFVAASGTAKTPLKKAGKLAKK